MGEALNSTLVAFTPGDRTCFGLIGEVSEFKVSVSKDGTEANLHVGIRDTYLTPDWGDWTRVCLLLGSPVVVGSSSENNVHVEAGSQLINGVMVHGGVTLPWMGWANVFQGSVGRHAAVISSADELREVMRYPVFEYVNAMATVSIQDWWPLCENGVDVWEKTERLMTMTAMTVCKTWRRRASMLKKMLSPPCKSSSATT